MNHCESTKTATGKPCQREAGWGTDHKGTGPCRNHDKAADEKLIAQKKEILEYIGRGTFSLQAAARETGIGPATLYRWRDQDEEFDKAVIEAVRTEDSVRVRMVEDSLFAKLIKGDATAAEMIFYLCNRAPERWRHVQRHEHTGAEGKPIEFSHKQQLFEEIERMAANQQAHAGKMN